jgi:uncharacterized protein
MAVGRRGPWVRYASRRLGPAGWRAPAAGFRARYRPTGPAAPAAPGSLAYFLTERYCLYAVDRRRRVSRLEIHHRPWSLQPAEAEIETNTMTAPIGLRLPDVPPLLHYAHRQDMVGWLPETVHPAARVASSS